MDTRKHADNVVVLDQSGLAVPRMVLGARLRQLREASGLSRREAGHAIRSSESDVSRLESGRLGLKPRDVADLLTLYGITEKTEHATARDLAVRSNSPGWWQPYADVIPPWMLTYLSMEQSAQVIRGFELQFIPGLLQTEDYAYAVIRRGHPRAPQAEIERRVELRMRRQQVLHRSVPPHLWVVIEEAALRRTVNDRDVMRAQLKHLIELSSDLSHITVQILPFEAGGHPAGPVTLLRPPANELPDVVYLEQLTDAIYPDTPNQVEYYRHLLDRLVTEASSEATTHTVLSWIISEL